MQKIKRRENHFRKDAKRKKNFLKTSNLFSVQSNSQIVVKTLHSSNLVLQLKKYSNAYVKIAHGVIGKEEKELTHFRSLKTNKL
jgi:hypothetical protein